MASLTQNLQNLLQNKELDQQLASGAKNPHVKSLQQMLFEMGFGKELNWDQSGADGDFGKSTTQALKVFAQRNGIQSDGAVVTPELANKIIERYSLVPHLKALLRAARFGLAAQFYQPALADHPGNRSVALCLFALGFMQTDENEALIEFARLENLPYDGQTFNPVLGKGLFDCLLYYYGDDFVKISLYEKASGGLTITEDGKIVKVASEIQQAQFKKYKKGIFTVGNQLIANFIETKRDLLQELDLSQSSLNVMLAVSENEGNLDAINTWDNSFMTFGIFQWTLGSDSASGELPALLKKIKEKEPQAFADYFALFGIDVHAATDNTYGFISYKDAKVNTSAAKDRFRFPIWGFRFWSAGQDDRIKAIQIEHAMSRLKNFYWHNKFNINSFMLSQIITSEYGVGLILDNHVNRPGYVQPCIKEAMRRTGLNNPAAWTTAEERKVIDAYLNIRETFGNSPMTDAAKRARVTKNYLNRGIISDQRNSFRYSATSERSLNNFPVPPSDYREEDYAEIRHHE
ncbi:MAG: peptidoglycan-binding protein [Saprospiraceae bacterium]|nr:peptidoglycan-binding protein [Saprospiraceae bacterium]